MQLIYNKETKELEIPHGVSLGEPVRTMEQVRQEEAELRQLLEEPVKTMEQVRQEEAELRRLLEENCCQNPTPKKESKITGLCRRIFG